MIVRPVEPPGYACRCLDRHADERPIACRSNEAPPPPVATPSITMSHDRAPLGSPIDITYKFVVADDARFTEDYRVLVHVVDADDELIFAVRSQSADTDHAVEARADDRVHAHRLHPGLSVRRRSGDPCRAALDGQSEAADAGGRGRGPERLQGRAAPAPAPDRERVHGLQGRLAPGRSGGAQRHRRMAVDEERRDAVVQEPEEGLAVLFRRRQPRQRVQRARSTSGFVSAARSWTSSRSNRRSRSSGRFRSRPRSWARRTWPRSSSRSTGRTCRGRELEQQGSRGN